MNGEALRQDVLSAFEFAHERDDWVWPLADALSGVTAREALWLPGQDVKGIRDIVLHMAAWTENCVERMRSGLHSRPAEGPWPAPPATPDDAGWEQAKARLFRALASLRCEIEATPSEALVDRSVALPGSPDARRSPLVEVLSRLIHNAYHIGQIAKLRELRDAQGASE